MLFVIIALAAIAAAASVTRCQVGIRVALASLLLFCFFSSGVVSDWLLKTLEAQLPSEQPAGAAQAIVVLGADVAPDEDGEGSDAIGYLSLERVFMVAREYRARGLPILVSGGPIGSGDKTLADLMADTLENDLHVPVKWRERRSQTTLENAKFSAAILRANSISGVILVAQRWDMPRAIWAFKKFGMVAVPCQQASHSVAAPLTIADFLPSLQHAAQTFIALHELIGLYYYSSGIERLL